MELNGLLQEINNLISIRQYVANSVNNFYLDKKVVKELNGMLILIDKKILSYLQDNSFKEYIDYEHVKEAILETAQITNIKANMKKQST